MNIINYGARKKLSESSAKALTPLGGNGITILCNFFYMYKYIMFLKEVRPENLLKNIRKYIHNTPAKLKTKKIAYSIISKYSLSIFLLNASFLRAS